MAGLTIRPPVSDFANGVLIQNPGCEGSPSEATVVPSRRSAEAGGAAAAAFWALLVVSKSAALPAAGAGIEDAPMVLPGVRGAVPVSTGPLITGWPVAGSVMVSSCGGGAVAVVLAVWVQAARTRRESVNAMRKIGFVMKSLVICLGQASGWDAALSTASWGIG